MVADLLTWYEVGKDRFKLHRRDFLRLTYVMLVLVILVPFSILALGVYDVLVRLAVCLLISCCFVYFIFNCEI